MNAVPAAEASPRTPVLPALPAGGSVMRVARAGTFAASSVALAVGAHRLGGGMRPTGTAMALSLIMLFGFGLVWAHRERRGPAITAAVLTSQLALHVGFTLAPMRTMASAGASSELSRWAAMLLCSDADHPATVAQVDAARALLGLGPLPAPPAAMAPTAMHMASPFTTSGAGMLAMHVGAALVMAWWLRRGERSAWAAARRVVAVIIASVQRSLPLSPANRAPRPIGDVWTPRPWSWGTGLAGRGPPAGLVPVLTA